MTLIDLTPIISAFLLGIVFPFLVALVTKQVSSAAFKSLLLLILSVLSGGVTEWITAVNQNQDFEWQRWALNAVLTILTGAATVLGFKPLVGQTGVIQNAVPGGLGKPAAVIAPAGTEPTVIEPQKGSQPL